jgi:hypothetical protein
MPIDLSKFYRAETEYLQLTGVAIKSISSIIEQQNRIRELITSTNLAPSALDEYIKHQQHQAELYRKFFSSFNSPSIDRLLPRIAEFSRISEIIYPTNTIADLISEERRSHLKAINEITNSVRQFSNIIGHIKNEYFIATPWLIEIESASKLANKLIDFWPNDDELDDSTGWKELNQDLEKIQSAIQQLPLHKSTEKQVRAAGLTRTEWTMLAITFLSLLFQILDYVESLEQSRLSRQQTAEQKAIQNKQESEERMFREKLISAIESIAERTPSHAKYVVGTRATEVKSSIVSGTRLGTAYPNQVVISTDQSGRWVKIKFRDNINEQDVEGWVLKHYLVRLRAVEHDMP